MKLSQKLDFRINFETRIDLVVLSSKVRDSLFSSKFENFSGENVKSSEVI